MIQGDDSSPSSGRRGFDVDDLVASSAGLAAGTTLGSVLGIALSAPVSVPIGLGLTGFVAGAVVGRALHDRGSPDRE